MLFKKKYFQTNLKEKCLEKIKNFSSNGIIIFALKNQSFLNSIILANKLSSLKKIPRIYYYRTLILFFCYSVLVFLKKIFNKLNIFKKQKNYFFINLFKNTNFFFLSFQETQYNFSFKKNNSQCVFDFFYKKNQKHKPILIVPVMITYRQYQKTDNKSLIEFLLGNKDNPSFFIKILFFLYFSNKITLLFSNPFKINNLIKLLKNKSAKIFLLKIQTELIKRIEIEKRAYFGPLVYSRDEMILQTIKDSSLIKYIENMAIKESKELKSLYKKVYKYLKEISADYNYFFIKIWKKILTWLWNNIYDGVVIDDYGFNKIKTIAEKMPFVVIPCHRSHIDYLLLSYVFEKKNISLPFIAAGTNLMFWPLSYIFRKSGAFFIRRTFKGKNLYGIVFSSYIKMLLKKGIPIEFFIEGGRSRTGKMIMPRYGLLATIIQAYQEGISSDLAIIPIFIGYDRVIEEKTYLREVEGEIKEQENAGALLLKSTFFKKRYGSVYINVGKPLFLKNYLSSIQTIFKSMIIEERRKFYRYIGYKIVNEINNVSVITPSALIASSLLCHYRRGISYNDLIIILNIFYDFLIFKKIKISSTLLYNKGKAILDTIQLFESSGFISKVNIEEDIKTNFAEIIYSIEENKRLSLEYYKNNILHFFIPLAFISTSIISYQEDYIELQKINKDYFFLKEIFRNEFIFNNKNDYLLEIVPLINYLCNKGIIKKKFFLKKIFIEIRGSGRMALKSFAGLIHNYLESYWITIRACSYLKKKSNTKKEFTKKIKQLGIKMYKKGEITRSESLSSYNYANALKYLVYSKILFLLKIFDKKNKKIYFYHLAKDKNKLDILRHKLFQLL